MSNKQTGILQGLKMFFGIFMVLFYLGVAALMVINFFGLPTYLSWVFAVCFAAYGIYRGYRELTGDHSYGMRRYDNDEDDETQYTTYSERLKQMNDINNHDNEKE